MLNGDACPCKTLRHWIGAVEIELYEPFLMSQHLYPPPHDLGKLLYFPSVVLPGNSASFGLLYCPSNGMKLHGAGRGAAAPVCLLLLHVQLGDQ